MIPSQSEILALGEEYRRVISERNVLHDRLELLMLQISRGGVGERMDAPLDGIEYYVDIPDKLLALVREVMREYEELAKELNVTVADIQKAAEYRVREGGKSEVGR